jgi:hypothetical protein
LFFIRRDYILFSAENELDDKQYGQDIHGQIDIFELSAEEFDNDIAEHSQTDSVGNGVGENHHDNGDKRRK